MFLYSRKLYNRQVNKLHNHQLHLTRLNPKEIYTRDNCAYKSDLNSTTDILLECIYLIPYSCDHYWVMDVGIYDPELDTQIIKLPAVIPNSERNLTKCFSGIILGHNCEQCFHFYSIQFSNNLIQAELNYTYQCEGNFFEPINISFGNVFGSGGICGQAGYYYPSCSFSLPHTKQNDKSKTKYLKDDNSRNTNNFISIFFVN